jgi:hypothetical protein
MKPLVPDEIFMEDENLIAENAGYFNENIELAFQFEYFT